MSLDELTLLITGGPESPNTLILWVFLMVSGVVIANFFARFALTKLEQQFQKTKTIWDDALIAAAKKPLSSMIWVVGLTWVGDVLHARTESVVFASIEQIRDVLVLGVLIWFVVSFIRQAELNLLAQQDDQAPIDETTLHAISKLLRTAVVITGVLVVLQTLGYNLSGVLAFGSIGGIAISFAAKDLLANFFGGMMVYMDRPFAVGDWIRSPDKSIEGTVEHIGWRTSRIRTFDQRPLYVPNSIFTTIVVENPSRMLNRRIYETIGLRYCDVGQLESIVSDVKAMLISHPDIDLEKTLMVNFNEFSASSIDFFIYTFTKTTNWVEYHNVKQDVLLKIDKIIAGNGAEVAFPTSTLHIPDQVVVAQQVAD
jgi:MscS family membrane protein